MLGPGEYTAVCHTLVNLSTYSSQFLFSRVPYGIVSTLKPKRENVTAVLDGYNATTIICSDIYYIPWYMCTYTTTVFVRFLLHCRLSICLRTICMALLIHYQKTDILRRTLPIPSKQLLSRTLNRIRTTDCIFVVYTYLPRYVCIIHHWALPCSLYSTCVLLRI